MIGGELRRRQARHCAAARSWREWERERGHVQLRQTWAAAQHHAGVAVYLRCSMATSVNLSPRSPGLVSRSRGLALAFGSWQLGLVSLLAAGDLVWYYAWAIV